MLERWDGVDILMMLFLRRSKNTVNILIKNMLDAFIGGVSYWLVYQDQDMCNIRISYLILTQGHWLGSGLWSKWKSLLWWRPILQLWDAPRSVPKVVLPGKRWYLQKDISNY